MNICKNKSKYIHNNNYISGDFYSLHTELIVHFPKMFTNLHQLEATSIQNRGKRRKIRRWINTINKQSKQFKQMFRKYSIARISARCFTYPMVNVLTRREVEFSSRETGMM